MPYATADQLAAALHTAVTPKTQDALELALAAASEEIDHELARFDLEPLPDPVPSLVTEVCIARAVEWWKASDAAFGALGFDTTGVLTVPKDGFARHAANLIPYKQQFGIA